MPFIHTPFHPTTQRQRQKSSSGCYVHKGHDPTACRRFLREKSVHYRRLSYLRRHRPAVCVNPCSKGCCFSSFLNFTSRGQQGIHSSAANEDSCGLSLKQIGTPICVPARKLLITLSNFPFLLPWLFMIPPPNHFPPMTLGRLLVQLAERVNPQLAERVKQCLTVQVTGPVRLAVPSPSFSSWELS